DPDTDGRPDPRTSVRENASVLGDLVNDFDFSQAPRQPMVLSPRPLRPHTDAGQPETDDFQDDEETMAPDDGQTEDDPSMTTAPADGADEVATADPSLITGVNLVVTNPASPVTLPTVAPASLAVPTAAVNPTGVLGTAAELRVGGALTTGPSPGWHAAAAV